MKKTREEIIQEALQALNNITNLDEIEHDIQIPVENGAWFAVVIFRKGSKGWEVESVKK